MKIPPTFRLIALAALFFIVTNAQGQALFRDDFNGSINNSWTINNKDAAYYSVTSTNLDLSTSRGDLFRRANDYKNLFLIDNPASGDFIMTARLDLFEPASNGYAQFCLVAYDSDDNYVRCNYGFLGQLRALEFGAEVEAAWSAKSTAHDFKDSHFYLQLRKIGTTYAQYYSNDGVDFEQVNPTITYGDGQPRRLGFIAMVDPTESSHAFVDYFTVTGTNYVDLTATTLPPWLERAVPMDDNASPDAAIQITLRDAGSVDAKSFQLFVDGRVVNWDVVTNASGKVSVRHQPAKLLEPGSSHSVQVTLVDRSGSATNSFSYAFSVNPNVIISK